jgi:heme/copper-type cytochrome/quinol oxidase subunit 2
VPEELLLLTYSGNPAISMSDETLLLEYEDAGVVEVTLVLLQPTTQTTATQQPGTRNVVLTTAVIVALAAILLAVSLLYLRSRKHR